MAQDGFNAPYKNSNIKSTNAISNWSGIDVRSQPFDMDEDKLLEMSNLVIASNGNGLATRDGTKVLETIEDKKVIGIYQGAWVNVSNVIFKRMIAVCDDGEVLLENGAGVMTQILAGDSTTRNFVTFDKYGNYVIITDCAGNKVKKIDASGVITDLDSSAPLESKHVLVFNDYLFLGGNPSSPQTLYYSAKGSVTEWDESSQSLEIGGQQDGDPIYGLGLVYGKQIIYKRNSSYSLSGTIEEDFVLSKVTDYGLAIEACHTSVNLSSYFLSDGGIYEITPELSVIEKTYYVEPLVADIIDNKSTTYPKMQYDKTHKRIFLSGHINYTNNRLKIEQTKDIFLILDIDNTMSSGIPIAYTFEFQFSVTVPGCKALGVYEDESGVQNIMFSYYYVVGTDINNYIGVFGEASGSEFLGSGYTSMLRTRYYNCGDMYAKKSYRYLRTLTDKASTASEGALIADFYMRNNFNTGSYADYQYEATLTTTGGNTRKAIVQKSDNSRYNFISIALWCGSSERELIIRSLALEYIYLGRRQAVE